MKERGEPPLELSVLALSMGLPHTSFGAVGTAVPNSLYVSLDLMTFHASFYWLGSAKQVFPHPIYQTQTAQLYAVLSSCHFRSLFVLSCHIIHTHVVIMYEPSAI